MTGATAVRNPLVGRLAGHAPGVPPRPLAHLLGKPAPSFELAVKVG